MTGRRNENRLYWNELVARQAASGLSVREFCSQAGVSEPSFYMWRRKFAARRRKGHEAGETAAKRFTLTKTCNRRHIDPYADLHDVYVRLPTMAAHELECLLPDRRLEEHPQHLIPERVQEALDRAQRARERRAERRAVG